MAAITVTLTSVCSGGGHLKFNITGDVTATVNAMFEDITGVISDEDKIAFVKTLTKIVKIGRTNAQAKAALEAGITINA